MFTLAVEGCDEELRVVRFNGHEALSTPFEFFIEAASATVPLESLVNKPALLTIEGKEAVRHVHGVICEASYIGESSRYTLYELKLVPAMLRLQQRSDCRIFQGMTTPDIVARVLEGAGIARTQFRLSLQGSFAPRDYCVQYRESDLDFISRLMEDGGIFYYFEHEEGRHVLVMTDHGEDAAPIEGGETLAFTADPERGRVTHFRLSEGTRPQRVSVRDKNLHRPERPMESSEGGGTEREIYDYPGGFQETGRGAPHLGGQQARLRLEALQASRRRGFGGSDCARLLPGFAFTLADLARNHLYGEYRIISVTHHGEQPQSLDEWAAGEFRYDNEFACIDKKLPYRPERLTPRPQVRGVQTATVVGPAGEEVHVDEHGRVKVRFHWDRRDRDDETSSCWVRVSQMWAGNGFGAMFIPRIGHEVIVDFLEGDPDRPLITGRVYTGFNAPPYPLPAEKTKSTIKSDSSPGGGGSNELRFEDAKGSEEIYLHAQRDHNTVVEHDQTLRVGHDSIEAVSHDRTESVANDKKITIGNRHDETIGADMAVAVGQNLTVKVGANTTFTCAGEFAGTIEGNRTETVVRSSSTTIDESATLAVGGSMRETVGGDRSEEVAGGKSVSVEENITERAGKNMTLKTGRHLNVNIGESLHMSMGKRAEVIVADKVTVKCGEALITIQKNGDITVQGTKLNLKASGNVVIKGSNVDIN